MTAAELADLGDVAHLQPIQMDAYWKFLFITFCLLKVHKPFS